MTGRINLTPEAERQLNEIDDWISTAASADVARRFVRAVLDHIDDILTFPFAGREASRPCGQDNRHRSGFREGMATP
jgi:plasmid stabilization system protein ParE